MEPAIDDKLNSNKDTILADVVINITNQTIYLRQKNKKLIDFVIILLGIQTIKEIKTVN